MGLGAYSVVRYADDLADQRINLGVLIWHPATGFRYKFSPAVDRVQAIDPRIAVKELRQQLDGIKVAVTSASSNQKDLLDQLCATFRYGLTVSSPYPAKISSVEETLEQLYGLLVSPVPEIRRASTQRMFENNLKRTLDLSLAEWPNSRVERIGRKIINGLPINMGMRTAVAPDKAALWHPLSLQAESRLEAQLANAKATVLDIFKSREINTYKRDKQYVAVQAPRARSASNFNEVMSCLKHAADRVFVANDSETLMGHVNAGLEALSADPRRKLRTNH